MPTLPLGTPDPVGSDPWVPGSSLASDHRLDDVDLPVDVTLDMCAEAAMEYLYKRSGRRFRTHDVVVRPNHEGCGCSLGDCWDQELVLPSPVDPDSIVITIGGVVLSSSHYRLYSGHLLVRTDGLSWPMCDHLSSPTGTDWSIAFTWGEGPGVDGILACREMAIHVAMSLSGKQSKIPARATSVSRGGLSINLLHGKRTGIFLVDAWLESVNPAGLAGRPSVLSPDTIRLSDIPGAPAGYAGGGGY